MLPLTVFPLHAGTGTQQLGCVSKTVENILKVHNFGAFE